MGRFDAFFDVSSSRLFYTNSWVVDDLGRHDSHVTRKFDVFFDLHLNKRLVIWDAITLIMTSLWCHNVIFGSPLKEMETLAQKSQQMLYGISPSYLNIFIVIGKHDYS